MSQEIRVRVWDGKSMLEFQNLTEWDIGDYNDFVKACKKGGKPPMLFTGLQDKHGEDIWEADILSFSNQHSGQKGRENQTEWPVVWSRGLGHWGCGPMIGSEFIRADLLSNIYEHPELLK